VVLTLPSQAIDPLVTLDPAAFNHEMARRFDQRLGRMALASTRHAYPLVAVYPRRLVGPRFACVGDAAVGMHPVTAHGFNFGLLSIDNLAGTVRASHAASGDVAAPAGLARYEQTQRRATLPLYLATQLITQLYTRDHPPARALRTLALHVGERLTPFKRMIAASLTGGA
jgi:2-polyprenyl-6-methoxyphenol hydroxylase-like FAD-dependent oxidoreductase